MEETLYSYFASYGAIGIIAFVLFKNTLQNHKEQVDYLKAEIATGRETYKSELAEDRKVYLDSISKITSRIDIIEDDVKDIKTKLEK